MTQDERGTSIQESDPFDFRRLRDLDAGSIPRRLQRSPGELSQLAAHLN